MDVVIPFKSISLQNNELLRYAVRSLEQNLLDMRDLYIIGDMPGILGKAAHIPCDDPHEWRWKNIHKKINLAVKDPRISESFLLSNDDIFLNEPIEGKDYPSYYLRRQDGGINGPRNFALHCPYVVHKELFRKIPFETMESKEISIRTLYQNFFAIISQPMEDMILREGAGQPPFDQQLGDHPFFSVGNEISKNPEFINWLENKYPERSRFES